MKQMHVIAAAIVVLASWAVADGPKVKLMRVPDGGIQPQVAVDEKGIVHLLYYKGPEGAGDLFYLRSADGGVSWSAPLRVNSQSGSAMSVGTIRGGHIAVGKNGRIVSVDRAPARIFRGFSHPQLSIRRPIERNHFFDQRFGGDQA